MPPGKLDDRGDGLADGIAYILFGGNVLGQEKHPGILRVETQSRCGLPQAPSFEREIPMRRS